MSDFTPELKRLLLAAACRFERAGKGDHEIWSSPIANVRFPVDSKIKSRHTANAVLKQAGCQKDFDSGDNYLDIHRGFAGTGQVLEIIGHVAAATGHVGPKRTVMSPK